MSDEIIGDIEVIKTKGKTGKPYTRYFRIVGYDEYGRFQSEEIVVRPHQQEVKSKLLYASVGWELHPDFTPKIGEWFWK